MVFLVLVHLLNVDRHLKLSCRSESYITVINLVNGEIEMNATAIPYPNGWAAIKTLEEMGYTYGGRERWKPPVTANYKLVGHAVAMPGTNSGFTMCVFEGTDVPVSTLLWTNRQP